MAQTATTGCAPYKGEECFHVTTPPGVLVFGGQTRELLYPEGTRFLYSLGGDSTTLAHRAAVDGFSSLGPASHTTEVGWLSMSCHYSGIVVASNCFILSVLWVS